jgi:CubicO group peptidase (beta-lactamase class C family)
MPLLLLLALHAAPADEDRAVDAAVRHAMKVWSIPGCAVVIVRGDRVAYCKGHGVRAAGKDDPVTPDTLFPLSSCSKAFTTAAMAMLAGEGKLSWDNPVQKHLPWFRLADPLVEREVSLRDLVCHRTGLAENELLWRHAPWPPEEAVRRLRFLSLWRPFRTVLMYQSTTFTAAGLAAASAAGTPWSDLIRQRLLGPLGMSGTRLSDPEAAKEADRAAPHRLDRYAVPEVIPRFESPYPDPAVSIHSSARDLGKWLRFHLAEGKPLVSPGQLRETHTPQMVVRLTPAQASVFPDTNAVSYAMGWAVHDYRGRKQVSHGGAIDGIRTHVTFIPDRQLGIAVLTNLERSPMALALANTLVDQLLGYPRTHDWHAMHKRLEEGARESSRLQDEARKQRQRHGTRPSLDLAAYAGDYVHPAYGASRIKLSRGKLAWDWRGEQVELRHYHYDTFVVAGELIKHAELNFLLGPGGDVAGFNVGGGLDVDFYKVPTKRR